MAMIAIPPSARWLRGTRDQPRRMSALGHDVWLVRYLSFIAAGFFGAVAGLLFVYYNKYIHPQSLSLTSSAEILLMVDRRRPGHARGPVVGAAVVVLLKSWGSSYVERWRHAARICVPVIVLFMRTAWCPECARLEPLMGRSA